MFLAALFLDSAVFSSSTSFDLRDITAGKTTCSSQGAASRDEIIVCAQSGDLAKVRVPRSFAEEEGPPQVEFGLFGRVRGKIHTERGDVGGFTSNRAMVTVTVPF